MGRFWRLVAACLVAVVTGATAAAVPALAAAVPALAAAVTPPDDVSAERQSDYTIRVTWGAVTGATGYQVRRATAAEGPFEPVATTTARRYVDPGLRPGTRFYYVVHALAGEETSGPSETVSASTTIFPPVRLWHTAYPDKVELGWDAVNGAVSYSVRRTNPGGSTVTVGSTAATSLSDTGVAPGQTYSYTVTARGTGSSSSTSKPLTDVFTGAPTVTTLRVSPSPAEGGQEVVVTVTVTAVDGRPVPSYATVRYFVGNTSFAEQRLGRPGIDQFQDELPGGVASAQYFGDPSAGLGSSTSAPVRHSIVGRTTIPAYQSPQVFEYGLGSWPAAAAVADVTGDGRPDALMTTRQFIDAPAEDFRLWVFAQQADGTLGAPTVYPTGAGPASTMRLATGDVDADGDTDVVIPTPAGVSVLRQSAGALGAPVTVPVTGGGADLNHGDLRIADMDGDGRNDLVVAGLTRVVVLPGNTDGTFGPEVLVDADQREQIEVADLTGDGRPDVATRDGLWHLAVHARTATGGYTPVWQQDAMIHGYLDDVYAIAVGDANGDGRTDLAWTGGGNRPTARVGVYPGQPGGLGTDALGYATYEVPETILLTDMNRDGRADAVVSHGGWTSFSTSWQRPEGWLGTTWVTSIPTYAGNRDHRALAVGDLSGDGKPDVIIADHERGLILVRQNT